MNHQNNKIQNLGILKLAFGRPMNICHINVVLMAIYNVYYKENHNSYQVWVVMNHVNVNLNMALQLTKNLSIWTWTLWKYWIHSSGNKT
jgi:hypothetical protein